MKKRVIFTIGSSVLFGAVMLLTGCGSDSGDLENGTTTLRYPITMEEDRAMSVDLRNGSFYYVTVGSDSNSSDVGVIDGGIIPDDGVSGGEVVLDGTETTEPVPVDPTIDGGTDTNDTTTDTTTDPATDPITAPTLYTIKKLPVNGTVTIGGEKIVYTPRKDWFGTEIIYIEKGTLEDLDYAEITVTFTVLDVPEGNTPPEISGTPEILVGTGYNYSFIPVAKDADGDNLQFSATGVPSWATFNVDTGELSGVTLDVEQVYRNIIISVTDGISARSLQPFSIAVEDTNHAPVLQGTPTTTIKAGQTYGFTPIASDADGDTLVFNISNKPHWATFDTATGTLSGVAEYGEDSQGNPIVYSVVIEASDGKAITAMPAFDLEVTP